MNTLSICPAWINEAKLLNWKSGNDFIPNSFEESFDGQTNEFAIFIWVLCTLNQSSCFRRVIWLTPCVLKENIFHKLQHSAGILNASHNANNINIRYLFTSNSKTISKFEHEMKLHAFSNVNNAMHCKQLSLT